MHPRQPCPPAVRRLAAEQGGVLSTEQVLSSGVSRHTLSRLVRHEVWRPLSRGVVFTRWAEPDWPALSWAGVLIGGDAARLAGEAAAYGWGFSAEAPAVIEVRVPASSTLGHRPPWWFRRERPGARSARSVGSPPRTTVEDTVLDLTDDSTPEQVVGWVTAAVQRRLTTPDRLRRAMARRTRLRHRRLLDQLVAEVALGAESPLEVAYLRDVERAHGLRQGRRQAARLRYRSDVSYDEESVLVELDGRLGHAGERRFRDYGRDNAFAVGGLVTLRYGWADVTQRPCEVAQQVAVVLAARGWRGTPTPCRRCAAVPRP